MSLTFPRVAPVAKGQQITSAQLIALANAFNARILSGLGDWHWRTSKYFENAFRQFRNSDSSGFLFPTQGEFFYLYQLIDADKLVQYPVAGPGEPEGANIANVTNQFVFGNPNITSEDDRLGAGNFPLWLGSGPPASLTDLWELGKAQRGVIESGGQQATPALSAALSWLGIGNSYYSPHGKAYGGYFASAPRLLDSCDSDPSANAFNVPSVQIKFTNTVTGAVVTYPGTCPRGSEFGGAGQVLFIRRLPIASFVFLDDGAGGYEVNTYSTTEWIEGPYNGAPFLAHTEGQHAERMIWSFIKDFRGSTAQRTPDTYDIEKIGFDFQSFLTKQYVLAPNLGFLSGGGIEAQYPTAKLSANTPANTLLSFGSGTTFTFAPGFVCAGIFAKATNLALACSLDVLDETGAVIGSLTLAKGLKSDAMLWLTTVKTPVSIRCKLSTEAVFTGGVGAIQFETTQLFPMKPQYWDAYLCLRDSATRGGFDDGSQDGNGTEQTDSKEIYDSLAAKGCIVNRHNAAGPMQIDASIASNPAYDAFRRFSRDCMRIIPRQLFLSYEVFGGKSILRFKRFAFGSETDTKADAFYAIAPPYQPVTELISQEVYIVRGTGAVSTSAGWLTDGQKFTAVESDLTFKLTGDAKLFIYDGIRSVARPRGLSNEWVMSIECHSYHWSDSSQWKTDAYGDYFTGVNRCHFQSGTISETSELAAHINFTPLPLVTLTGGSYTINPTPERVQAEFYNPEAPTGYNYADGSNDVFARYPKIPFYKSCQIYQAPYEVESVIVEVLGGIETVKVTLKTRLHAHESAPATVDKDPSTWLDPEIDGLRITEDYRTDDNAIREYAFLQSRGTNATFKTGDAGAESAIEVQPDNPYGAVMPKFFFTKLLEKPYEDGNNTTQLTDTRCTIDVFQHAEVLLRAGCEGFVDGLSTEALACTTEGLYDYSWQSLCFHGFGGTCICPIDRAVRNDSVGFSALPNTIMSATQYNQIASCVNLLNKARIQLPMQLRIESDNYRTNYSVTPSIQSPLTCATGADSWAIYEGGPITPAFVGTSGPVFDFSAGAGAFAFFGGSPYCASSTDWNFASTKSIVHYTAEMIDTDSLYAIPQLLKDLMVDRGTGFLARFTETIETVKKVAVSTIADSSSCCSPDEVSLGVCTGFVYDSFSSTGYKFEPSVEYLAGSPLGGECRLMNSGTLDPGNAPATTYAIAHRTTGGEVHECGWGGDHRIGFGVVGEALLSYFSVPVV